MDSKTTAKDKDDRIESVIHQVLLFLIQFKADFIIIINSLLLKDEFSKL
jgi:hypothetical protein